MNDLTIRFSMMKHIKIKEKNVRSLNNFLFKLEESEIKIQTIQKRKNNYIYIKSSDNEKITEQQIAELSELLFRSLSSFKVKFLFGKN